MRIPKMRISRVVSALAAAALLGACKQKPTPPTAVAGAEVGADMIIYGLRHKVTTDGVRKADLYGDTAVTKPNSTTWDLKGVRLSFFDENGKQTGALTSRTGQYDVQTGMMIARGNAVLVLQNGPKGPRTIRTDELHYEQKADRIWSEKATSMEEAGQTYRGTSFTSDTHFQNVTVKQLSTSNIQTKGGGVTF
jgi:LPS export ABC transporter protein LptC